MVRASFDPELLGVILTTEGWQERLVREVEELSGVSNKLGKRHFVKSLNVTELGARQVKVLKVS